MGRIQHKYLAHFIDASFNAEQPNYVRLGKDLEEYTEELNPNIEIKRNILGEQVANHNGYEVSSEVTPFYAYRDDPMTERLMKIANERLTGEECMTTKVDLLLNDDGSVVWAYREDCLVVPKSVGGGTDSVEIPFTVTNCGGRVKGIFDLKSRTFTPDAVE